jgi:hypothetical protein
MLVKKNAHGCAYSLQAVPMDLFDGGGYGKQYKKQGGLLCHWRIINNHILGNDANMKQ